MIFTDQMGNKITLEKIPERIVSLVPSQSEFLWDIGLHKQLTGITKFCIHPAEMFTTISRIGGTKKLNIEKIRSLNPDIIIGNKEENEKEQIEILQKEFNVWMSDIYNLGDAFEMMNKLGKITGKKEAAASIAEIIKKSFNDLPSQSIGKAIYLIWKNPYISAGKNTFIDEMMKYCGFENAISENRYPELNEEKIREINPEFILLSSEPYPFSEKHIAEFQKLCPHAKIIVVDGELFSWYGSRLQYAADYFLSLRETV